MYAAGAVPGEFVPGLRAAFLTSAAFAGLAFLVATAVLRPRRRPALARTERAGRPSVEAA